MEKIDGIVGSARVTISNLGSINPNPQIEYIQLYLTESATLMLSSHYGTISYVNYLVKEKERLESQNRHAYILKKGKRICLMVDKIV